MEKTLKSWYPAIFFKRKFCFSCVETVILEHLDLACVTPPHILPLQPSNFILMSSAAIQIARLL